MTEREIIQPYTGILRSPEGPCIMPLKKEGRVQSEEHAHAPASVCRVLGCATKRATIQMAQNPSNPGSLPAVGAGGGAGDEGIWVLLAPQTNAARNAFEPERRGRDSSLVRNAGVDGDGDSGGDCEARYLMKL